MPQPNAPPRAPRIPVGGEIFLTRPDRALGPTQPPTLLFPRVKRPGRGVDHTPPSSAKITPPLCLMAGYSVNFAF
jgi:hypothetical protein